MKKLLVLAFASLFALGAQAASEAQKAQQEKMKSCNAEAKSKTLKGAERKTFMKGCLSGATSAAKPAEAKAPGCADQAKEKKLAGAAQASFVKKCEADAKAGGK
ncbi:MAG: phosphate starvation-inducible protein PsiF [Proteobacteria bacterium]|nr:phosphate starvation-inducible protein PsiF [Pseudomonadota bacterium]